MASCDVAGLWDPTGPKGKDSGARLERRTVEGESPVREIRCTGEVGHPSRPGHEKSRSNLGGPSSKAKYEPVTDSE